MNLCLIHLSKLAIGGNGYLSLVSDLSLEAWIVESISHTPGLVKCNLIPCLTFLKHSIFWLNLFL